MESASENISFKGQFQPDLKNPTTGPIIIDSKTSTTLIQVIGLPICAVIAFVFYTSILKTNPFTMLLFIFILVVIFPVFFLIPIHGLYRLLRKESLFMISKDGIWDNFNSWSLGKIGWNEIERIYGYKLLGQKVLGISLKNQQNFISQLNPLKQLCFYYYRMINVGAKTPITISEIALGIPVELLIKNMERYIDAESRKTIQIG